MKNKKLLALVEGAIMVAIATVLSYIRPFGNLPFGGSITLLSMLPIVIFSIRRDIGMGFMAAFAFSLIQLLQGIIVDGLFGWGLTAIALISCIFLDYIFAYTVLGIAGVFRKNGFSGWIAGIVVAIVLRFFAHIVSGAAVFHSTGKIWDGLSFATDNTWLYSFLYNGAYMIPELILTVVVAVILLKLPQTKKFVAPKD